MSFFNLFLTRHEPVRGLAEHLKSAVGATLAMLMIGGLAQLIELPLMIAPLGATAVLVFGYPGSALAQPLNVFGAYLVATVFGVLAAAIFPGVVWAVAVAVGLTLFGIQTLRITHPPAGAVPLVAAATPGDCGVLFVTLLVSSAGMVALALVFHALPPRRRYPAAHPGLPVQS
ncbi:MAG: HPP family protein [Mesorhizobium sp.]